LSEINNDLILAQSMPPGAVHTNKGEAALWLGGNPGLGFLGDVGGMVVEDQLDGSVCRISGVKFLENGLGSASRL
jgi:hypothetical protein